MDNTETVGQLAERERAMAKAMSMSVLFKAEYYGNIVDILGKYQMRAMDEKAAVSAFAIECNRAGLDEPDQVWLWNYLKNYDKELASRSDAKWPVCAETRPYW